MTGIRGCWNERGYTESYKNRAYGDYVAQPCRPLLNQYPTASVEQRILSQPCGNRNCRHHRERFLYTDSQVGTLRRKYAYPIAFRSLCLV